MNEIEEAGLSYVKSIFDRNCPAFNILAEEERMLLAFEAGAEWQRSQEQIDKLLTQYIGSVDTLDKMKIAQYVLIVLAQMAVDTNAETVKLSTDLTYKDKRYNAQMVISFKEDKKKSEEICLERIMDTIMRGGKPTLTGFVFTQAQFDKLVPYVEDSEFLNVLKSRVLRK